MKIKPLATALKNKIIGGTANVLSAYPQYKAFKSGQQAQSDMGLLKKARAYDNAPSYNNGMVTDAGMTRSLADDVRTRLMRNK